MIDYMSRSKTEINLEHFTDLCNAVRASNPVAPPTLLVSRSTYERHREWIDKLDAHICIIPETTKLGDDNNIWIIASGQDDRCFYA